MSKEHPEDLYWDWEEDQKLKGRRVPIFPQEYLGQWTQEVPECTCQVNQLPKTDCPYHGAIPTIKGMIDGDN